MRLVPVIAVAISLLIPYPSFAQGWTEFVNQQDFFTVNFPGEPEVSDITFESEYSISLPGRVYSYENGSTRYSVRVIDYTGLEAKHAERAEQCRTDGGDGDLCVNRWKTDMRAAIIYVTWPFFQRDGEVTHMSYYQADRVEGQALQLTNADGSRTYVSINMHEDRLYILEGSVPPGSAPPMLFQQSLGFIDEEGQAVRYESPYTNGFPAPPRAR